MCFVVQTVKEEYVQDSTETLCILFVCNTGCLINFFFRPILSKKVCINIGPQTHHFGHTGCQKKHPVNKNNIS